MFAVNKSRLDDSIQDAEVKIDNYKLIRKDRNRYGGGVATYVHNDIKCNQVSHPSFDKLEAVLLLIDMKKSTPLLFVNWYRSPNCNTDVISMYEDMLTFIEGYSAPRPVIIMGDINLNILQEPLSADCKKYYQINNIHGLHQINTCEYTRVSQESRSLIDHIVCSHPDNVNSWGVHDVGFSDHSLSYISWKTNNINDTNNVKFITFRKSKGVDIEAFKMDMGSQNWSSIESLSSIDEAVCKWEEILTSVVDKHMPIRTKRVKKKQSPWLNETIFNLMKKRDKIKKKAKVSHTNDDWKEYRKTRNKVTFEIKKAKKKYYTEKIKESQGRAQSWEILKLLMPAKCSDSVNNSNDKNENVKLANKFNTHFANVANSRTYDDNITNMAPVKEANCNPNPLELSLVTEMDVLKEIYALKNKKSAGIDGISSYILKLCAFETVKGITYIINRSIFEGKVPTRWKIVKITPLFKKGDKDNPDHYRPISLLPCVSKLLERVIQRQLIRYLLNNNILSKCQSGFRSKHSTSSALIKVTDEWLMSLDSGMYSGSVFIDLQKAFDLVDLDIL